MRGFCCQSFRVRHEEGAGISASLLPSLPVSASGPLGDLFRFAAWDQSFSVVKGQIMQFTVMQRAKPTLGLLDYAVHQTNLEQVRLGFLETSFSIL